METIKQIVDFILKQHLTKEDILSYRLISLKAITKTKKEWNCCSCNQKILIGSQSARSFKKIDDYTFEKQYWCHSCLKDLSKELSFISKENVFDMAF